MEPKPPRARVVAAVVPEPQQPLSRIVPAVNGGRFTFRGWVLSPRPQDDLNFIGGLMERVSTNRWMGFA